MYVCISHLKFQTQLLCAFINIGMLTARSICMLC